jgi:transcriptional regulator with XRE-family HTH domain
MSTRAQVTNQKVADDLGITHSAVSRIRSGDRRPSLDVMLKMHEEWKWPLDVQAFCLTMGTYTENFEAELVKRYDQ